MSFSAEFLLRRLAALATCKQGATLIEYGLIVAIISAALIGALTTISGNINLIFQMIIDTFTNAMA